ncbi:MAG: hypothetical protein OIF40_13600, partial [Mangrovicoccus sp.]|nr:hypothetical protein [Mangrovicoccus sp.]
KLHFGGAGAIGDGELYNTIGGALNIYRGDNDVEDILTELLLGAHGGDCPEGISDSLAGIDGVELVGIDGDSFTIQLTNMHGATDTMIFSGGGVEKILQDVAAMSSQMDIADDTHQFIIIDGTELYDNRASVESIDIGTPTGELEDVIGTNGISNGGTVYRSFFNPLDPLDNDILMLLEEIFDGDRPFDITEDLTAGIEGVDLIDVDKDSFALNINGDTLLFTNIETQIKLAESEVLVEDSLDTAELIDLTDPLNVTGDYIGLSGTVGDGELKEVLEANAPLGGLLDLSGNIVPDDIEALILEFTSSTRAEKETDATGIDGVELVGVDEDSLTFIANGDTIIIHHDYFELA